MLKGIPPNVFFLGLVSLLNDTASEAIFSVLPVFMSAVLRIDYATIGVIEGAAESAASFLKLASGWASDRMKKRKGIALAGYALSSAVKPLFAFAAGALDVAAIRVLDRIGKGVRTSPRDALVADSTPERFRGKAFGFHRAMDTLGAVAGPLLAFAFLYYFGASEASYRNMFLLTAIPGAASLLLLWLFVKEKKAKGGRAMRLLDFSFLSTEARAFMLAVFVFSLTNYSYAFLVLRAGELGVGAAFIPLLYLLYNIVYASLATPAGALADRIGGKRVLAAGWLAFIAVGVGFALAGEWWQAVPLFVLYGCFSAVHETVVRSHVSLMVAPARRGSALGALHFLLGIGALPASAVMGWVWSAWGASAAFALSAAVAAAALLILAKR
ncbi:MAG: MFS transporter [Candidatus Micrarchaeia archaeon]